MGREGAGFAPLRGTAFFSVRVGAQGGEGGVPEGLHGGGDPLVAAPDELGVDLELGAGPGDGDEGVGLEVVGDDHLGQDGDAHAGAGALLDGLDAGELERACGADAGGGEGTLEEGAVAAGVLGEEQLLGDDVVRCDAGSGGERVVAGDDGADGFGAQGFDDEVRLLDGLVDADGYVDAGLGGWAELTEAGGVELDPDLGVAILEGAQEPGQAIGEDGLGCAEGEGSGGLAVGVDGVAGLFGEREEAVGVGEQTFAGGGELDAAGETVEEGNAELLLEGLNLRGDAGLCVVEDSCGAGEAALADDGGEGTELTEVEHIR